MCYSLLLPLALLLTISYIPSIKSSPAAAQLHNLAEKRAGYHDYNNYDYNNYAGYEQFMQKRGGYQDYDDYFNNHAGYEQFMQKRGGYCIAYGRGCSTKGIQCCGDSSICRCNLFRSNCKCARGGLFGRR